MKGDLDELTWAFIQVAILLVFVTWAINPIFKSLELAQQNSARLNAQELAGVINTMQASPADMTYTAYLPPVTCTVEINEKFVKFDLTAGGKRQVVVMNLIQTPTKIYGNTFQCRNKKITIVKSNGRIDIN
jgi:hypothetical protein